MRPSSLLPCLALAALPALAGAQPVLAATGAFVALSVPDLEASTRWYVEKLGLAVTMRVPKQNGAAVTVLEGGGLVVELVARDDATPLGPPAAGARESARVHGLFKAGVVVADFDRTLAALRARGVAIAYGPFPATATQRANVIVRDDAGNLLQLFGTARAR